jgi:hypothetical protein
MRGFAFTLLITFCACADVDDRHTPSRAVASTSASDTDDSSIHARVEQLEADLVSMSETLNQLQAAKQALQDQVLNAESTIGTLADQLNTVDERLVEVEEVNPIRLTPISSSLAPIVYESGPRVIMFRVDNMSDHDWFIEGALHSVSKQGIIDLDSAPAFGEVRATPPCEGYRTVLAPKDHCEYLLKVQPLMLGDLSLVTGLMLAPIGGNGSRRVALHRYDITIE